MKVQLLLRSRVLFIFLFLLISRNSFSQEVIVTYDFSASMRMYELNSQDFANWNRVLKEVLFRGEPGLSGNVELIYRDATLYLPLVIENSVVTFIRLGNQVRPFFEKQIADEAFFSRFLPTRFKALRDQNTYVSKAELYFLRAAINDPRTIWVNVSDEDEDVNKQLPPQSGLARELTLLRNDVHVIKLLDISFHNLVHLSVRKLKAEYKQLLSLESSRSKLLFREVPGKKRSEQILRMARKNYFKIQPNEVGSGDIHNVALRITLNDEKERELAGVSMYPAQLPAVIDSLVFTSKKALAAVENKEKAHLFIRARYYYGSKLYHQDFVLPITYGSGGLGWLFWLLFIPLFIAGGIWAAKSFLFQEKTTDQFTLLSTKPRSIHKHIRLKKNERILLGPRIGQAQGRVCDIKAPDYAILRKDLKAFSLLRNDKEEGSVSLKSPFTVKDRDGNEIELTLHQGHIKIRQPEKTKRRSTLSRSSSPQGPSEMPQTQSKLGRRSALKSRRNN